MTNEILNRSPTVVLSLKSWQLKSWDILYIIIEEHLF